MNEKNTLHSKKTIAGTIHKVLFRDEKSGKVILLVERNNGKSCRLLGKNNDLSNGCPVEATGVWGKDEKYGWQFIAESIQDTSQREQPQEPNGMLRALDFSNILPEARKEERFIAIDYDNDEEDCLDYGSAVKPKNILDAIDRMECGSTRKFVPRDMTPYIAFLNENHAIGSYPIVPVKERIGDSVEKGALFTIMINGQPNIVWENYKDSRATFVFKCTKEDYADKRQRVFDFVMANETGKRALLHTDKSKEIFGMKPRIIIHNDLPSWSARLMSSNED